MNERVEKLLQEERNRFLIEHGLYEKEYAPPMFSYSGNTLDGRGCISWQEYDSSKEVGDTVEISHEGMITKVIIDGKYQIHGYSDDEYPEVEYINDMNVCYRKKAIEVTDEEYEALRKVLKVGARNLSEDKSPDRSSVATIFYVIAAIIFILGFFAGIGIGNSSKHFEFLFAVIAWASAFVSGMIFVGFGKIIELLNKIYNK